MLNIPVKMKMKYLFGFLLISLMLAACNKKNTVGVGQFMFVNAGPELGSVDILFDGTKFNTSALPYGESTGYQSLIQRAHVMKVTSAGSSTSLYDASLSTAADIKQSFYIYDRLASLKVFAVEDLFNAPSGGKANIRFFHLCAGAPLIDVGTISGTVFTPVFTSRTFENSSSAFTSATFTEITAGTYTFEIRVTGAGTPLLTVNNIQLQDGKSYSLFAKGISGNVTTPLLMGVVENK